MLINYRKAGLMACALLTLTLIPGCFKESYPRTPVKDITRFSLGSAHFTPFKKRPKAKELYNKMVQFYGTFSGVELTYITRTGWKHGDVCDWGMVFNYRTKLPFKALQVVETIENGNRTLDGVFCNDGKRILRYENNNTYSLEKASTPDITKLDTFELIPFDFDAKTLNYDLLPDGKIKGDDVYVLKLSTVDPLRYSYEKELTTTYLLYVAKSDLLLRKAEEIIKRGEDNSQSYTTYTYSGIVANPNLPDSLFDTKPPRGAKREKESRTNGR